MKNKLFVTLAVASLAMTALVGCNKDGDVMDGDGMYDMAVEGEFVEEEDFGPVDFLQEQSGETDFASFDEVLFCLQDGQGYAFIDLYGAEGEALAVTDHVFEADGSSDEASIYVMLDGKAVQVGNVFGNGSANPIRIEDGIIYGGTNHTYESYFMGPEGGLMMKDYLDDGVNGDGEVTGFTREDNNFDATVDFAGTAEDIQALIEERDAKPAIVFTIVGQDIVDDELIPMEEVPYATFTELVDDLQNGQGYANVTIGNVDALVVSEGVYDNQDGKMAAIDSIVYAYGEDGDVEFMGMLMSAGTAYPIAVSDDAIFCGGNHEMIKKEFTINGLEITQEAYENFDEDGNASYSAYEAGSDDEITGDAAKAIYDKLIEEYEKAEVVDYTEVVK